MLSGTPTGPGFSFSWLGPVTGNAANLSTTETGTYTLVVTSNQTGCTASANATVLTDTLPPQTSIALPNTLNCLLTQTTLSANVNMPAGYSISWSTADGHFVSGTNTLGPVIDAPGSYQLLVQNTANGCTGSATVTVNQDIQSPVAEAGTVGTLDCNQSQTTLDGTGSDVGMQYLWTGPNVLSGATTLMALVGAAGQYVLQVTNPANGCTSTDVTSVGTDTLHPLAIATAPPPITCINFSSVIDASGSSNGSGFSAMWTTLNGQISSGANTLLPTASAAGSYNLTVTNLQNGCTAMVSVVLQENTTPPVAEAGTAGLLHCNAPAFQLAGSGTPGSISYQWSGPGISSGGNTPTPTVDQEGTYILVVTRAARTHPARLPPQYRNGLICQHQWQRAFSVFL